MTGAKKTSYFALLVSTLLLLQCSPIYQQKTLTFFFDGVPDTTLTIAVAKPANKSFVASGSINTDSSTLAKSFESKFNLHKPYKEHLCEKCHDGNNIGHLTMQEPELCFSCHKNYDNKYAFVHGPVSAGYCLACHNPHMSENKSLLTRAKENTCYYCHNKPDVLQSKCRQGANESNCTQCHNPHGGKDRFLSN